MYIYSLLKDISCNRPSTASFYFEGQMYHRFKNGEVKKVQEV